MLDYINIFNVMTDKSGAFLADFRQTPAMDLKPDDLPDDIDTLKAMVLAAEAKAADVVAQVSAQEALIAHLQLLIEKMRREKFGPRSERTARLLDQLELELEEACAAATEDEWAAEQAAAQTATTTIPAHERKRPVKKPLPAHLPRERVVVPGPEACSCCGGTHLAKLGEDITETLEVIPRQWKVIQTVREKFTCRDCDAISQAPAPFHAIPRGLAGPSLLAMILFEKYGCHQPLNRQAERYAREGVEISLSTMAGHIGACCFALTPLFKRIEAHVLAAERLHGDDTTVPVLAKGGCDTARCWTYVRDDQPFGGTAPPAALFYYSRDRAGVHPRTHLATYAGILQADAYSGYGKLYDPARQPGAVTEALCWAHSRRKLFELADIAATAKRRAQGKSEHFISPLALEGVRRIDAIFAIERDINGKSAEERLAVRRELSRPLVDDLHRWMLEHRPKLASKNPVAKAMDYMLKRWTGFTRFLDDGRIDLSNNAAERALRGIAMGRKSWLFAGSDRGGQRAAIMYTLIATAKLNDIDPQAWLADVLARIADYPNSRIDDLLPWNWRQHHLKPEQTAA
jgi:transposase